MYNGTKNIQIWKPENDVLFELDLDYLKFEVDSLVIAVFDRKYRYVFCFSNMIEGLGSYKYTSLTANFVFNDIIAEWLTELKWKGIAPALYKTQHSDYISWISDQSYNTYTQIYPNHIHYIICTYDAVVEVVCSEDVKFYKEELPEGYWGNGGSIQLP